MKTAVVGATGLVGGKMLQVLEERQFPVDELVPVASERSAGTFVRFRGKQWKVLTPEEALDSGAALALFSAGAGVSLKYAPLFAGKGCRVVDNSSCWRMDPSKKLIVPEINGDILGPDDWIIANPNCSTIQMVLPLAPLHRRFGIKRIVVSTYQSVTGSGFKGICQLEAERRSGKSQVPDAYPHRIDLNVIPHIDSFLEDGSTKEERKMVDETRKILSDNTIGVSATTVRVPVRGGHSESVNVEFRTPFDLGEVRGILSHTDGVVLCDDPLSNLYPMPLDAEGRDEVFVGRLRRDASAENALNLWCVSDNLRKGAATNAVQIAETLLRKGLL